jgi:SbsC C-terminal domain
MKKLIGAVLISSLLYGNTQSVSAASLSETIKQVDAAAKSSRILHENYIRDLDYETMIGTTPYNNARLEVGKAKKMVDSLPASEKKSELLKRVAGYQKVVQNGNAYNNAVRTNDILEGYSTKYLDPYFLEYTSGGNYNYFSHKLSLLQPNYDKVYGTLIQNEFKKRYLNPIKYTRNQVYYLLNAREDLYLARKALDLKDTDETQRQLNNAGACLDKVSDSAQKKLLVERLALFQNLLDDEVSGVYDTYYITKKNYSGQFSMKVSFNLKGENMRFWIADAEEYPSYESLKSARGNEVYGYHSSRETDGFIEEFNWTYRDLSNAYHSNIVWGYYHDDLIYINNHNDKIIPAGTDVRIVLEVEQEDGAVIVKEEVVTITEELFQKAHVN